MALKHQIILAPAVVLLMMTLLLGFLQYSYWDLSVKRQQARDLKAAYIALAEADLAAQRMISVFHQLQNPSTPDAALVEQFSDLYDRLDLSIDRLQESVLLTPTSEEILHQSLAKLNPEQGVRLEQSMAALQTLRPQLRSLLEQLNQERQQLSSLHREDIDELVAETTFIAIVVLGSAILIGIFLSLMFARRILRRMQVISSGAERISQGDFVPLPAPEKMRDELDGLALSINQMTDQLIRVVAAEKVLEGAEDERRRIAMDIHDQTLAELSSVRRRIEQLRQTSDCGPEAADIESELQRAMDNLRVVMDNLHPQTLDILGLSAALESHLEKVCGPLASLNYHYLNGGDLPFASLNALTKVTLYRIAVEAVHNVIRHAGASQLEVALQKRGDSLILAVEDNGRGFDYTPQPPTASGGHGLHNIQERARAIGACVHWGASRFSSGTRFELSLPINAG